MDHDNNKSHVSSLLLDLPIEERLIVSCSNKSIELKEPGTSLLTESQLNSFDYDRFFELAQKNGVIPLIYSHLRTDKVFPAEFIERLKFVYLQTAAINLHKSQELIKIIQVLNEGGIDVIPLKGPVAAENIFGGIGLYPFSDIDILVRTEDLSKAEEVLAEKTGYVLFENICSKILLADHYHYIYIKENLGLEVHWNLVKRYFRIPEEFWWEGTHEGDFQKITILELEPEKYFLYLIFRLFDHQFQPLRFLLLTSEFLNRENINWQRLFTYAEKYGMKRLVLFVLCFLNELYGAKVPEPYLRKRILFYEFLSKLIVLGFLRENQKAHMRMLAYVTLLDSPQAVMTVIFRRVFPSIGEIRLRYSIAQDETFKAILYYVMNPFLLVFRKR